MEWVACANNVERRIGRSQLSNGFFDRFRFAGREVCLSRISCFCFSLVNLVARYGPSAPRQYDICGREFCRLEVETRHDPRQRN